MRITGLRTVDVRFPTSAALDGSDAMNPDPDYSAAYVVFETDGPLEGHGLTFTIGRGNEICVAVVGSKYEKRLAVLVDQIDIDALVNIVQQIRVSLPRHVKEPTGEFLHLFLRHGL